MRRTGRNMHLCSLIRFWPVRPRVVPWSVYYVCCIENTTNRSDRSDPNKKTGPMPMSPRIILNVKLLCYDGFSVIRIVILFYILTWLQFRPLWNFETVVFVIDSSSSEDQTNEFASSANIEVVQLVLWHCFLYESTIKIIQIFALPLKPKIELLFRSILKVNNYLSYNKRIYEWNYTRFLKIPNESNFVKTYSTLNLNLVHRDH